MMSQCFPPSRSQSWAHGWLVPLSEVCVVFVSCWQVAQGWNCGFSQAGLCDHPLQEKAVAIFDWRCIAPRPPLAFFFFLVTPLTFSFVFVLLSTISFKKRRCLIPPPVWAVAGSYSFQYHPFWASVDWNDGGINDEWLRLPQMWFPLAPLSGIGDPLPQVEFLLREKIIENENLN